MSQTFEEYLKEMYESRDVDINDDNAMEESYLDWRESLITSEVVDYAEKWHKREKIKAIEQFFDSINTELVEYFQFDSASEAFRQYLIRLKAQLLNSAVLL